MTKTGEWVYEAGICVFQECFAPYSIGLITQPKSPFKAKFDSIIMRMVEAGLIQHWFAQSLKLAKEESISGV